MGVTYDKVNVHEILEVSIIPFAWVFRLQQGAFN